MKPLVLNELTTEQKIGQLIICTGILDKEEKVVTPDFAAMDQKTIDKF